VVFSNHETKDPGPEPGSDDEGEEAEDSPVPMESVMGTAEVCFLLSDVDENIGSWGLLCVCRWRCACWRLESQPTMLHREVSGDVCDIGIQHGWADEAGDSPVPMESVMGTAEVRGHLQATGTLVQQYGS
jgi:hypothetical protein